MGSAANDNQPHTGDRLDVLDGMRGLAALLVVIFHFTARWSEPLHGTSLYPYGDIFINAFTPVRYFGEIGVRLFFLISGFVIILTLQRCSGILDFAGRRASRLWPTMLVCATLTTLLVNGTGIHARLPGTEYWEVQPLEYLLSIIFFDPGLVSDTFGLERLRWVDGVYWTLWAEVRFYALISLTFWLLPRHRFLWGWAIIQAAATMVILFRIVIGSQMVPLAFSLVLQPSNLAWFTLGMCGYFYWKRDISLPIILAAGLAILSLLAVQLSQLSAGNTSSAYIGLAMYLVIFAPFILFLIRSPLLTPLASPSAVAIGLASYPLYLFHERVGIIATTYLTDWGLPPLIAMVITLASLIAFAIALSRSLEHPVKSLLLRYWRPFATRMQDRQTFLQFQQTPAKTKD